MIYEELSQDLFDICYKKNILSEVPPEVKSVRKYIQNYHAKHIPVDIKLNGILSSDEIQHVFNAVRKYTVYSNLEKEQKKIEIQ